MTRRRRGLTHRFTALLLAAAMPVCCCFMNVVTGGGCCAASVAAVSQADTLGCCAAPACCMEGTLQEAPPPGDTTEACTCCMKAPGPIFTWTLPVDSIGTPVLDLSIDTSLLGDQLTATIDTARHGPWSYPPPSWLRAAAHRGIIILNC